MNIIKRIGRYILMVETSEQLFYQTTSKGEINHYIFSLYTFTPKEKDVKAVGLILPYIRIAIGTYTNKEE